MRTHNKVYIGSFKWLTYYVNRRQLDNLHIWKALVSAYSLERNTSLKHRYQILEKPDMQLENYIKPVSSPSLDWVTFLTLSNVTCSRTDLIKISQLPNIGALTIGPGILADEAGLDDGIVRSWARVAATTDAFHMLRVLSCRSQKDITHKVLTHLTEFPALAVFIVENCGVNYLDKSDALRCGWEYKTGESFSANAVGGGVIEVGWDSMMHSNFQLGGLYNHSALTAEDIKAIDELPRLHLSLGNPPRAAVVNAFGDSSLRSFCLVRSTVARGHSLTSRSSNKRPSNQDRSSGNNKVGRRSTMRVSKQQGMEALLNEYRS